MRKLLITIAVDLLIAGAVVTGVFIGIIGAAFYYSIIY